MRCCCHAGRFLGKFALNRGHHHKLTENNPSVCSLRSIHLPFQGRLIMSPLKGARRVCLVLGCQRKLTGGLNPRSSLRAFFQGRQKTPLPIHFKMFHVKHQSLRRVICVNLHAHCRQKHRCAGLSETQTKPSMRMSVRQNEKTPADTRECQHTLKNSG